MVIETPHEAVYVVDDWYDGPRSGYADYQQKPHFYRSLHLDINSHDDYNPNEDRFELTPVSVQVVEWAITRHQLWLKWDAANRAGALPEDAGNEARVLPEDRVNDQKLRDLIEQSMNTQARTQFFVRGKFEPGCSRVQWYEINA